MISFSGFDLLSRNVFVGQCFIMLLSFSFLLLLISFNFADLHLGIISNGLAYSPIVHMYSTEEPSGSKPDPTIIEYIPNSSSVESPDRYTYNRHNI